MEHGRVIDGRFAIEALAGTGGMGAVYRARDRTSGGLVALKILLSGLGDAAARRFEREAEALAALRHPAIVRYVAHGVTGEGQAYLAMEWVDGESLGDRLARGPLDVAGTVRLGIGLSSALAAAHRQGLIHRDVKPRNVLLEEGDLDRARLADFGLARALAGDPSLTRTGVMLGTPGFMSPEQARGLADIDARADVFALGCVLYQCLAGKPAFRNEDGDDALAVLLRAVTDEPTALAAVRPDVPAPLVDLVTRMLAKDRDARPAHGGAVLDALTAIEPLALAAAPGPGGPSPARAPAPALTTVEQTLTCVVLVRCPDPSTVRDVEPAIKAIVKRRGADLEVLADGSALVTVPGTGAPTDHAACAARCALALRPLLPDARVALVLGRKPRDAGTAAGEVLDRAVALLHEEDAPGIRLDDGVVGLLEGSFDVVAKEGRLFLGGERDAQTAARTLLGRVTPFVGRDREMAILEATLAECVESEQARAVVVIGAAGVGKSRLRQEFLRAVRARGDGVAVWIGRAEAVSAGPSAGPLGQALRGALSIREGEPAAARRQKLRDRIAQRFEGDDVDRLAAFLGNLVGVPAAAGEGVRLQAARQNALLMADQTRRAFEDFLDREAAAQPILLVLEDLHWADHASVDLVDAALRTLDDRPLFVLATARPEVTARFPRLWAGRSILSLPLGELPRKHAERLARAALGPDAPASAVAAVVDRGGGHAFFLEELVRAVAAGRGGALPPTVLAMVEARLEVLEPEARRVLRAASVFGEVFWRGGVHALASGQGGARRVDDWLAVLADAELIVPRTSSRFAGEDELAFRHAIHREVAYATLTGADRTLGHRLAGAWLDRAGEGRAAVLAGHFERGGDLPSAARHHLRAAEQALAVNDLDALVAHAERAAACGLEGADVGMLRLFEAQARRWRGEFEATERLAAEAMDRLVPGSAPWLAAATERVVGSGGRGEVAALEDAASRILAAPALPDPAAAGVRTIGMARATVFLSRLGRSLGDVTAAWLDYHEPSEADPTVLGRVWEARAWRALIAGDSAASHRAFAAAVASFEQAGDTRSACSAAVSAGAVLMYLGAYADAARSLESAVRDTERLGLANAAAGAKHNLGLVLARLGRLDEGRAIEEAALRIATEQGDVRICCGSHIYLAEILLLAGDLAAAEEEARSAVTAASQVMPLRCSALATLAHVLLARGASGEALPVAAEGMELLATLGGIEDGEANLRLAYAETLAARGDVDAARAACALACRRLFERAEKIGDLDARRSFLERVPEHARTISLARAMGAIGDAEAGATTI